ncbi:MAG: hypothetical protein JW995_14625 [Melioribacteraceae bacterium]|nr:hypothetical protein [Melioribacteraceae bacterium]
MKDFIKIMDILDAWCIAPYDSVKRLPDARINMLNILGLKRSEYDWSEEYFASMQLEPSFENQKMITAV